VAIAKSKTEQLKQIQALLSTATNSRQRVMYEDMLAKLKSQMKEEEDAAVKATAELKQQAIAQSKVAIQEKVQASADHKGKNKFVSPQGNSKKVVASKNSVNQATKRSLQGVKDSDEMNQIVATKKKKKKDTKPHSKKTKPSAEEKLAENSVNSELRFRAMGVLEGEISLAEKGLEITIDGQQYPLGFTFISKNRDYRKFQEELSSGSVTSLRKRVSVYPQVKYVDKKYCYFFNLVSVHKEGKQGIFAELEPGEFYLSGLWQHVKSHPVPCLSVYRNATDDFFNMVAKQPLGKVRKLLKPIQVPVEGLDLTQAFKYNPQAEKNKQKKRKFYCLSATFSDARFAAIKSSISEYSKAPKYITASRAAEFLNKVSGKN
jgi:hypothetical protein